MSIEEVERRPNRKEEGGWRKRDTQNQLMNPFVVLILSRPKLTVGEWVLLNLCVVWKLTIHVSTVLTALGEEGNIKSI